MSQQKPLRVFLLIGLTKESSHWDDDFVAQIKQLLNPQEIIAFDLPGAGSLLHEKSPITINETVKRCRLHYKNLFDNSDYDNLLVSISLGGIVAIEWLRLFPQDFQRLVIINSSFRGLSPLLKRLQPKALNAFRNIFKSKTVEEREHRIIKLCSNNEKIYNNLYDKWVSIANERPMSKPNMLRQTVAAARYKFKKCPKIPAYVIASKHDRLAHYSCSQKIHKKIGGQFHLMEDKSVGHGVHMDAPVELANLIHKWIKTSV